MTTPQPIVRNVMKIGESLYVNIGVQLQAALGIKRGDMVTLTVTDGGVLLRKVDFAALVNDANRQHQRRQKRGKA